MTSHHDFRVPLLIDLIRKSNDQLTTKVTSLASNFGCVCAINCAYMYQCMYCSQKHRQHEQKIEHGVLDRCKINYFQACS